MIANYDKLIPPGHSGLLRGLLETCCLFALMLVATPVELYAAPRIHSIANQTANSELVYPVMGPRTSSGFGMRRHPIKKKTRRHHHGIDLAAPSGSVIRTIASGQVMFADPHGGYGNLVVIKHTNGFTSHYGHCKSLSVHIGQRVKAGDIIGTVGSTGVSTGPHLHFEIRVNGVPQHPEKFLPGLDSPAQG